MFLDMMDTRSNMQLADLNSKRHGGKSLINPIDRTIGSRFYYSTGSVHYKILQLDQFHGPSRINCEQKKRSEIKMTKISNVRNRTTNTVQLLSKKTARYLYLLLVQKITFI